MIDSVFVSNEIESRVDKENLFGHENAKMIPVCLYFKNENISGDLYCFSEEDGLISLKLKIISSPLGILILQKKIEKLIIGSEDSHCIVFDNPTIESTSLIVEEDMYICQIIMNN